MEKTGYVKIYRIVLENPIIKKPVYAWLWTVLLLKTNHKETKMIWNGKVIIIKEGQFITGRKQLSKETNIPESTIERILEYLENEHQIEQQKTTKFRLITIVNWKKYQQVDNNSDNKRTTSGQQADTNKNDKNDKNDKNNSIAETAEFDFLKELEKLKNDKRKDLRLIAFYWKTKDWKFENKKQFNSALKRELRPAKDLIGYTGQQVAKAMKHCEQNYKEWSLETVNKSINRTIHNTK